MANVRHPHTQQKKEDEELARQRAAEKAARDYSLLDVVDAEDEGYDGLGDEGEGDEGDDGYADGAGGEDGVEKKKGKGKRTKTVQEMMDDFM